MRSVLSSCSGTSPHNSPRTQAAAIASHVYHISLLFVQGYIEEEHKLKQDLADLQEETNALR